MRHRYLNWVEGLNGDWLVSRQRFFGVPFPVWYPLDADGEPDYDQPLMPRRGRAADRPDLAGTAGYDESQRGQARWVRRRPRCDGHLGDVVADPADRLRLGAGRGPVRRAPSRWTCARRRTRSSGPGCSPRVVRAHFEHGTLPWAHVDDLRLRRRPGPQEDVASPRATRSSPTRSWSKYGSDAVRWRAAMARPGLDIAVRRVADEGRPAARDQGAERVEVRARLRGDHGRRDRRSPSRSTWRCCAGCARSSTRRDGGVRAVRLHRALEVEPSGSSGPSATTTSSWSRSARTAVRVTRPRLRRRRRWPSRCRSSCGCSRRTCRSRPKRCGRGGRRVRSTCRRGRRRTPISRSRRRSLRSSTRSPRCSRGSAAPSRRRRSR